MKERKYQQIKRGEGERKNKERKTIRDIQERKWQREKGEKLLKKKKKREREREKREKKHVYDLKKQVHQKTAR